MLLTIHHFTMRLLSSLIIACLLFFAGCQHKSDEHQHGAQEDKHAGGNQELYDKVMEVHDEVMPKMNDLYKAKTTLKTRLEMPGVSEDEKKEISEKIVAIDSASEGMMVWMRQFNPIPDSLGEDKARAYLESELVRVTNVREDILKALKKAE